MCGICGIKGLISEERNGFVDKMSDTLYHRGPDEEGRYFDRDISLGIRRLSIIDLETGSQPIYNEDKTLALVCNGEIYNFHVLKDRLIKKGHNFYTNTDAEVLVHLYEEYGLDCLKYLKGMFAFALWDKKRRFLFIARDRFGIKPLYFYNKGGIFAFASELKALLKLPFIKRRLNIQAMNLYFSLDYVPSPHSIFQSIYKLKPAHYILYKNDNMEIHRYWDLNNGNVDKGLSLAVIEDKFEMFFCDSLKEHLISDVPLGIFLSGGIDSSALVSSAAKISNKNFSTFSVGFGEKSFDESRCASLISNHFGIKNYNFTFTLDNFINSLDDLTNSLDEPFADLSVFPTYMLAKRSQQYIKVALSGEGADELFMGYPTYVAHRYIHLFNRWPDSFKAMVRHLINSLPVSFEYFSLDFKLKQILKGINEYDPILRHVLWMVSFSEGEKNKLFNEEFRRRQFQDTGSTNDFIGALVNSFGGKGSFKKIQYLDIFSYLSEDILVKSDRSSMLSSLEVRVPYLDHELVEFLWNLDFNYIYRKKLLKRYVARNIPKKIIARSKKGFAIPFSIWLRDKRFLKATEKFFSKDFIERQGLFNCDYINYLLNEHLSGERDNRKKIRTYIMFQYWYKNWFEQP